jgi:hypothetical protein
MKGIFKALSLVGALAAFAGATTSNGWENGYIGQVKTQIGDNNVIFTILPATLDACGTYTWWQFDGSTSQGKNMLTAILSAKATGKKIQILANANLGGVQPNGCGTSNNILWSFKQVVVNQ